MHGLLAALDRAWRMHAPLSVYGPVAAVDRGGAHAARRGLAGASADRPALAARRAHRRRGRRSRRAERGDAPPRAAPAMRPSVAGQQRARGVEVEPGRGEEVDEVRPQRRDRAPVARRPVGQDRDRLEVARDLGEGLPRDRLLPTRRAATPRAARAPRRCARARRRSRAGAGRRGGPTRCGAPRSGGCGSRGRARQHDALALEVEPRPTHDRRDACDREPRVDARGPGLDQGLRRAGRESARPAASVLARPQRLDELERARATCSPSSRRPSRSRRATRVARDDRRREQGERAAHEPRRRCARTGRPRAPARA